MIALTRGVAPVLVAFVVLTGCADAEESTPSSSSGAPSSPPRAVSTTALQAIPGTVATSTTDRVIPLEDTSLVEAFLDYAKRPDDVSFSRLPLAGRVALGLGPEIIREVEATDLRDPGSWVLDVEEFRAYVGPFSALQQLERSDDYSVRVGDHPHCVAPSQPAPEGFEAHSRVSVQPSDDSIDSCLMWWTVDFFVSASGFVEAITTDLWEP